MQEKTETQGIAEATNSEKPDVETIKILKSISKHFSIGMDDIKVRYTDLIGSRAVQSLDVQSEVERERHATRILVAKITSEVENKYIYSIDEYCDFCVELSIIRDHIARTSTKIVNRFGKEYSFHGTLEEIDRVRGSLEDKMNTIFFGGK